ncbi:MAG: hypothetical protein QOC80_1226, partial [Frankiaceae bacterium]|nr:hypothetical protein [Frankiaceae bacterium]
MTLPPALSESATDRLRPAGPGPAEGSRHLDAARAKSFVRRTGGRVLRKAEAVGLLRARKAAHQANVRLDEVENTVDDLRNSYVSAELQRDRIARTAEGVDALAVNQESLKAELREVQRTLDDLGWAIAPGAGLGGAEVRLAELRERVNGLDRRLRSLA